jgi:hypothetical protein
MNDYLFDKHIIILLLIVKPTFKDELAVIVKQASDKQKQVRRNLYLKWYRNLLSTTQNSTIWKVVGSNPVPCRTYYS